MEVAAPPRDGERFLLTLLAEGLRPDPRRPVSAWAEAERVVSEGAYEGRWRNHRAPYLVEPMDRCSLTCRTPYVSIMGSSQIGKTQIPLNLLGQILCETPCRAVVALPTLTSMRWYNRDKLDLMIRGTPALAAAVADVTERSGQDSTTAVKRGARGAQVELVTASSSADLQSRSAKVVIAEEVSEYDSDVGGRGDPVDQLEARTIAYRKRGFKVIRVSTPSIRGQCRISRAWEDGSQGEFHVKCPHCDQAQTLRFANLKWPQGRPAEARYACEGCGVLIEERDKAAMLRAGAWVHAAPERLAEHASYRINVLYSPFTPWSAVAREAERVEAGAASAKNFAQQWLGEAWDEAHDLPKADILLLRRDRWQPGRIPPGVLLLMGATDVQGDRLVWAVWGFDRQFSQWLIETGVIEGDPTRPEVWTAHDALLRRTWRDAWGKERGAERWGIDAGYLSTHVYAYARRHGMDHTPLVMALDGRPKWKLPALGQPSRVTVSWQGKTIGKTNLWPVGTWDLKSELAAALRLTEQGPGPDGWPAGAVRFNEQVDRTWIDELLSEQCVESPRTGERTWKRIAARNEAWDLAVYARALARGRTVSWSPEKWDSEAAARLGPPAEAQADLAELWTMETRAMAEAVAAGGGREAFSPPPAPVPPRRDSEWIRHSPGWLR